MGDASAAERVTGAGLDDLLAGLDGAARAARTDLIAHLLGQGFEPDAIRRAAADDRLTLLPVDRVLSDEGDRTLEQIAADAGVDVDDLERTRRALGPPAQRGAPIYGDALADHAERLRFATAAGVPVEALVDVNRVIGR